MSLTLSVTDQSPMRRGESPSSALRDTVLLAQAAERLGYARYWVAEHHNTGSYAGTSPEIVVGQLLANTSHIRVGSGGVMLSHYSALKVAEQFSVLDSFYPGRVDLGVGRAPGSDHTTMFALAYPKRPADIETFPQQVVDLIGYLHNGLQPDHPFAAVKARPGPPPDSAPAAPPPAPPFWPGKPRPGPPPESAPEVWLLGSSDYSANLAAYIGLPFAFADFFGHTGKHGPAVAEIYRRNFRPSPLCPEPRVNVTAQVVCAPTEEEARFLASSRNLNRARRAIQAQGGEQMQGLAPPEEASQVDLSPAATDYVAQFTEGYIDGDPTQVKEALLAMAKRYETTDVGVVTITYRLEDRIRSYELVAREFGLQGG